MLLLRSHGRGLIGRRRGAGCDRRRVHSAALCEQQGGGCATLGDV